MKKTAEATAHERIIFKRVPATRNFLFSFDRPLPFVLLDMNMVQLFRTNPSVFFLSLMFHFEENFQHNNRNNSSKICFFFGGITKEF